MHKISFRQSNHSNVTQTIKCN